MAKEVFRYKGEFDVSGILKSIERVRAALDTSKNPNKTSLINVDNEIKEAKRLEEQLKKSISQGFSDKKEYGAFEKTLESFNKKIDQISLSLSSMGSDYFAQERKAFDEQLKHQKQLASETQKRLKSEIQSQMQALGLAKKYQNSFTKGLSSGSSFDTVLKRETQQLERQLEVQQEIIRTRKELITKETNKNDDFYKLSFAALGDKKLTGSKAPLSQNQNFDKIKDIFKDVTTSEINAEKALKKFRDRLKELGLTFRESKNNNFSGVFENFYSNKSDVNTEGIKQYEKEIKKAEAEIEKLNNASKILNNPDSMDGVIKAYNEYAAALQKVTRLQNSPKETQSAQELKNAYEQLRLTRDKYNKEISKGNSLTQESIQTNENLNNTFDNLLNYFKYMLSLGGIMRQLSSIFNKTKEDIKQLDAAFGSIAMVTKYSVSDMWAQYGSYAEMANRLGQSTKDVIASSALFYQQGLDTVEVMKLTESTMKLATLANTDFEEATKQMTAAIRGFHLEMEEGNRVTDIYSELAANAAANVHEIAYSMSKVASLASSSGMEIETTAAFLTQMIESTQEAPKLKLIA